MKINNIQSTNFNAKVVRNPYYEQYSNSGESIRLEQPLQKTIQEYDKQIAIIEKQKQSAIELDRFMSSKEVKNLLDELPEEDEIILKSQYSPVISSLSYSNDVTLADIAIQYSPKNQESKNRYVNLHLFQKRQVSSQNISNSNGLDKEKLTQWLFDVRNIFGN